MVEELEEERTEDSTKDSTETGRQLLIEGYRKD